VVVGFFEAGLMHMSVAVLGSVLVGVGVLVLNVLVVVLGVRVRVSDAAVFVLVRVWTVMRVLIGHIRISPYCERYCAR
jgi:hypothetical protein